MERQLQQLEQLELIKRAQHGDKECFEQLTLQVKDRLHLYVYRLTQQQELTQEIVQESLVEMFKVIGKLREPDRFWPWLYGIATNKLRRYYRKEQTQRKIAMSSSSSKLPFRERQSGFENLVSEELKNIISTAMNKLKTSHKAVLVMRCYDDMAYSEIAESLGSSEFGTRMLFMRAKRALQKELARNGLNGGSLLAALIIFGKMTAPTKAAAAQITVSSAALKVGLLAGAAGLATTKTAVVSIAAASVITAGTATVATKPWVHNQNDSAHIANYISQLPSDQEQEYMFYFPQGSDGAMMLRATTGTELQILQNDQANYYYENNTLRINNYRVYNSDLSVMKIPTDDIQMTSFISRVESSASDIQHITARGRELLVIASRSQGKDNERPWAIRHSNVLEEDYFQSNFPATARIIDNRDQMHKRGWTYFTVSGQINNQPVSGTGRIPFVYSTSTEQNPWFSLKVGSMSILDTSEQVYVSETADGTTLRYRGGSFFEGLSRPWMGLHTIDTIRRDAAQRRIVFETNQSQDNSFVEVVLFCDNIELTYKVNLETDVVEEITFSKNGGEIGNLRFDYLQSVEQAQEQFELPAKPTDRATLSRAEPGNLWLVQLVEGSFR